MGNVIFDSKEEEYMWYWLVEARSANRVLTFTKCQTPFPICDKQFFTWFQQMKTKVKPKEMPICQPQTYLPDYHIVWNPEYEGELYMNAGGTYPERCIFLAVNNESYIDVKGTFFGKHSSDIRFSIKQSLFLSRHNKYVQKISPLSVHNRTSNKVGLFEDTFCPDFYLSDPDTRYKRGERKGASKINFQTRTMYEYFQRPQIEESLR